MKPIERHNVEKSSCPHWAKTGNSALKLLPFSLYFLQFMKNAKQPRSVIGIKWQTSDPDYPVDIWFDSLKSVANVLSKESQQLFKVIAEQKPQSVTELAALTGRAVSNVSRTPKTLQCAGIVQLVKSNNSAT